MHSQLIRMIGIPAQGGTVTEENMKSPAAQPRTRRSDRPLYQQIAQDLARRIETGLLPPSAQLPTELELMEEYNASRNTVRDAVKLLITRSLVETRPGQGTFVVQKIVPFVSTLTGDPATGHSDVYDAEVRANKRTPASSLPRVEVQKAREEVAAALNVPPGTSVVSRHQERFIDDTPWSMQTSFYPMSLVRRGADRLLIAEDIEEGVVRYLAGELSVKQVGYRDLIRYRPPDQQEISFFRLPPDGRVGVISILRTAFAQGGEPIRVTITVYPADRNQFAVSVGEVPLHDESSSDPS